MPYKNGRYIRGGNIQSNNSEPVKHITNEADDVVTKPVMTQEKIKEKIKNIKVEESKADSSKVLKERLKKFVKLEIK